MKRVYLGGETFIKDTDIIGVFDIDTSSVSKKTRDFLEYNEKEKNVVYSNIYEFPRSFILTKDKVFITPTSTITLNRKYSKNIF